jgi:hypothetical protein
LGAIGLNMRGPSRGLPEKKMLQEKYFFEEFQFWKEFWF